MDFNLPIKWNDYEDIAIALLKNSERNFQKQKFTEFDLPNSWNGCLNYPTLWAKRKSVMRAI